MKQAWLGLRCWLGFHYFERRVGSLYNQCPLCLTNICYCDGPEACKRNREPLPSGHEV